MPLPSPGERTGFLGALSNIGYRERQRDQFDPFRDALLKQYEQNPPTSPQERMLAALAQDRNAFTQVIRDPNSLSGVINATEFTQPKPPTPAERIVAVGSESPLNEQFGLGIQQGQRTRVKLTIDPQSGEIVNAGLASTAEPTPAGGLFGNSPRGRARDIIIELAPLAQSGGLSPYQQRVFDTALVQAQEPVAFLNPVTGDIEMRRPELPAFAAPFAPGGAGGGRPATVDPRMPGQRDPLAPLRAHAQRNIASGAVVKNSDGSTSTVRSGSVEDERLNGGRPTLIPFVWEGRVLDAEAAIERAIASGEQWPSFPTNEAATAASKQLSESIEPENRENRPNIVSRYLSVLPSGASIMEQASNLTGPDAAIARNIPRLPGLGQLSGEAATAQRFAEDVTDLLIDAMRTERADSTRAKAEIDDLRQRFGFSPEVFNTPERLQDQVATAWLTLDARESEIEARLMGEYGDTTKEQKKRDLDALQRIRQVKPLISPPVLQTQDQVDSFIATQPRGSVFVVPGSELDPPRPGFVRVEVP